MDNSRRRRSPRPRCSLRLRPRWRWWTRAAKLSGDVVGMSDGGVDPPAPAAARAGRDVDLEHPREEPTPRDAARRRVAQLEDGRCVSALAGDAEHERAREPGHAGESDERKLTLLGVRLSWHSTLAPAMAIRQHAVVAHEAEARRGDECRQPRQGDPCADGVCEKQISANRVLRGTADHRSVMRRMLWS